MERESFIFYKSFYDSIKELDPQDQAQIYNAIFSYQFEGKIIELKGVCKSIFTLIIPQLEANNKRYVNGCKGGAPKGNKNATKKQPKNNQELTKKQPNENVNENDNVNENEYIKENIKRKNFIKPTIEEIENYCQERNNNINAKKFYDYYEEGNWKDKDGKQVKNWKQKIITWEGRNQKQQTNETTPEWFNKELKNEELTEEEQKELDNTLNSILKDIDNL